MPRKHFKPFPVTFDIPRHTHVVYVLLLLPFVSKFRLFLTFRQCMFTVGTS